MRTIAVVFPNRRANHDANATTQAHDKPTTISKRNSNGSGIVRVNNNNTTLSDNAAAKLFRFFRVRI